jgi:TonB-dependent receptor
MRAQDIKRDAIGVMDAVSAENVGEFPNSNIAEALQRIPGIAIDRNGGEGQFVSVRGLGPEFNTVLIDGRRIASDTGTRAFDYELFPADVLASAEVYKTGEAWLPDGGIGGTINLKTLRPLDIGHFKAITQGSGLYDRNTKDTSPQAFGLVSDTFADNTFGVLGSVSFQERRSQDSFVTEDGWLPESVASYGNAIVSNPGNVSNFFLPREEQWGVRDQFRRRLNIHAVFEWSPSDRVHFALDGMLDNYTLESNATVLSLYQAISPPIIKNIALAPNGTVLSDQTSFEFGNLNRLEGVPSFTRLGGFHADFKESDTLSSRLDFAWSHAFTDPALAGNTGQSVIGLFTNNVNPDGSVSPGHSSSAPLPTGQYYTWTNNGLGAPIVTPNSAILTAHNTLASQFLHVAQFGNQTGDGTNGNNVSNRVFDVDFDNDYHPQNGGMLQALRFGLHFTYNQDTSDYIQPVVSSICMYCGYFQPLVGPGYDGTGLLHPVSFPNHVGAPPPGQLYGFSTAQYIAFLQQPAVLAYRDTLNGLAPGASAAQLAYNIANYGGYVGTLQPNSFSVTERDYSGYIDALLGGGDRFPWKADIGFRWVVTREEGHGGSTVVESISQAGASQYDPTYGPNATAFGDHTYLNMLPDFNGQVTLLNLPEKKLIGRLGIAQTMTRPQLNYLAPNFAVNDLRPGSLTANQGNPDLKPYTSDNVDLSLEYYFGPTNYVAVAGFWKRISDFIVQTAEPVTVSVPGGINITVPDPNINTAANTVTLQTLTPQNIKAATVKGLEVSGGYSFDWLPSFLRHLGATANATWVGSSARFNPGGPLNQVFAIPGVSDTATATVYYDDGRVDLRASWSYRGSFLETLVNPKANAEPIIDSSFAQLDFRAAYNLPTNFAKAQVFVQGINILDQKLRKHGRFSDQFILLDDTGPRYELGVRAEF